MSSWWALLYALSHHDPGEDRIGVVAAILGYLRDPLGPERSFRVDVDHSPVEAALLDRLLDHAAERVADLGLS